jgi:hypothetical protein
MIRWLVGESSAFAVVGAVILTVAGGCGAVEFFWARRSSKSEGGLTAPLQPGRLHQLQQSRAFAYDAPGPPHNESLTNRSLGR